MKKYSLIILLLLPQLLLAQRKPGKISFYIGGGYLSDAYLNKEVFHSIRAVSGSGKHNCVILSSGLALHIHPKWMAGITGSFDHFGLEDRSVEYHMTSVMAFVKNAWFNKRWLELSTTVAAGMRSWHMEENDNVMQEKKEAVLQVCPIVFGFKADRFVFELKPGFGVSGVLQFGAWYRF